MDKPVFKIMIRQDRNDMVYHPNTPQFVPWDLIKDHQQQAMFNHDQSLQKLHSRGGLDPVEFYAVFNDITWKEAKTLKSPMEASVWLIELVAAYNFKMENQNEN